MTKMGERLTSRDCENRLLFAGRLVIAGEHCQAYLELEEAEDRITALEAEQQDVSALVARIRRLKIDLTELKEMMKVWADKYFEMSDRAILAEMDRDKLKRRAEALERAVRLHALCRTCSHFNISRHRCDCGQGKCRDGVDNWKLDLSRFTPEQEERG